MSATTQTIVEEIEQVDVKLRATKPGDIATIRELVNERGLLIKRLNAASTTLTEGKRLLKD